MEVVFLVMLSPEFYTVSVLAIAGSTPHDVNPEEMQKLAEKSDGYSGSDIAILVRDAIMMPVRTLQSAQYFKKVTLTCNRQLTVVR